MYAKYVASPTSQMTEYCMKKYIFRNTKGLIYYQTPIIRSNMTQAGFRIPTQARLCTLPVMLVGFADVPVISETIVDTGCDVVVGSADTVDELISTSTALATFYTSPFVCAL